MRLDYQTYVFDNDGVLLDSNDSKDQAFIEVASPYGQEAAQKLLEYHQSYGGVSRFEKLEYLFRDLLKMEEYRQELDQALSQFGQIAYQRLLACDETLGMKTFLQQLPPTAKRYVVSGGLQSEIRTVFQKRGLDQYFDGIYGSPADKYVHMQRLQENGKLPAPVVFVGDSRTDYEVARAFGCHFVFLKRYTGFTHWQDYFADKDDLVFLDTFADWDRSGG